MKKRIIICLLCLIMLFSNITPAISFKAYAADEYVEDELLLEENDSYASSDDSGNSDDYTIIEEGSLANSSDNSNNGGVQQISEDDAAAQAKAENDLDDEVLRDHEKLVFYDRNSFHYAENGEEPDDVVITEAEYLESLEKDKNNNGILDILEEDEDDEVHAAAMPTGFLGDLNGDENVDNKDVVVMYRYLAGWEQDINDDILDFNGDGYINTQDASHLMKYVSGWPDTVLYEGKKYDITYHLCVKGRYIENVRKVDSPEPYDPNNDTKSNFYYSSMGLSLPKIQANGYTFEGWYDGEGQNANLITKIAVGETGDIELFARWTPDPFRIDFVSEHVEVAPKYYTIETGATLTNPVLSNYIFVGWTNQENGQFIKTIPKGSFGDLTLVANWASRRNLARPVQQLEDPIIVEDENSGKILFLYRLGDIENVPLFTLYRFSTAEGMSSSVTLTEQTSISTSDAMTISSAVASATTDSATWTLSEGWNDSTSVSEESLQQTGLTREEAESIAKSSSNTYRLDTTVGGSTVIVDSSQHAFKGTFGSEHSDEHQTEDSLKLSVNAGLKSGIATVSAGAETGSKDSDTTTDSWKSTLEGSSQDVHTETASRNWNRDTSYSNSSSASNSQSISEQLSELISDRYGYGQSYSKNGEHSSGQAFTTQTSSENKYSNTVTYDRSTLYSKQVQYSTDGTIDGYYRQVLAGTAHVFGVVGYDVATCSYFAYTFTVMDDETYEFLDYSKFTPNFDDNETGVLPFEIPVYVNEYVNNRITRSEGLEINIATGMVTGYTGEDPIIVIPSYINIGNGDGTYSSVKITGFADDAFRNNTNLRGIIFGEFVTEIPDSAFEGCTSLRDIYLPNLTHIGNRAFYGCSSLSTLTIPDSVITLGNDAFYNVNKVKVTASNKDVALAAMNSGVKNLVLNISSINEEMSNTVLEASSTMRVFEVQGGRKQYSNLQIISQANTTRINGITFVDDKDIPLILSSSVIDLNQTSVSASRYCMIISSESCDLNLFGTNQMNASKGDAIICGNVSLSNSDTGVQATLQVSGNIYVCGNITNANRYINHTSGNIIQITPEEFANLDDFIKVLPTSISIAGPKTMNDGTTISLTASVGPDNAYDQTVSWSSSNTSVATINSEGVVTGIKAGTTVITATANGDPNVKSTVTITVQHPFVVYFNANTPENNLTPRLSSTSMAAVSGTTLGTLPTANCDYYDFLGWYTASNGGERKTASSVITTSSSTVTLYAHWQIHAESSWVNADQIPTGARISQTKTQYRYSDKETTTGTSSTMNGWTLYDTQQFWSDYGPWSDWSSSAVSASESTKVETRTAYLYYYYVCSSCGAHMHGYGTCYTWAGGCGRSSVSSDSYHSVWETTPYSSSGDFHGTGVNYITSPSGNGTVFAYTSPSSQHYVAPQTQYRSCTREQNTVYYFYRWLDWSSWSDTVYTANDNRRVETQTLYRYIVK